MQVHKQWRPKPSKLLLRRLLRQRGLAASRCVLVEDSIENLKSAKFLGMRTVWFSGFSPRVFFRPGCADVQVKSLHKLPGRLSRLRR
jgi:putative hydrolase of the HAD superfamily